MMITRLAATLGPEVTDNCLLIRARWVVRIFVTSDVCVFLLQAAGGGLSATSNADLGDKVSFPAVGLCALRREARQLTRFDLQIGLIGLIVQVISYSLFSVLLVVFALRVRKNFPQSWNAQHSEGWSALSLWSKKPVHDWRILFIVMCLVSVAILVSVQSLKLSRFKLTDGHRRRSAASSVSPNSLEDMTPRWQRRRATSGCWMLCRSG